MVGPCCSFLGQRDRLSWQGLYGRPSCLLFGSQAEKVAGRDQDPRSPLLQICLLIVCSNFKPFAELTLMRAESSSITSQRSSLWAHVHGTKLEYTHLFVGLNGEVLHFHKVTAATDLVDACLAWTLICLLLALFGIWTGSTALSSSEGGCIVRIPRLNQQHVVLPHWSLLWPSKDQC